MAASPVIEDLRAAQLRLRGQAAATPLLRSSALDRRLGGRLLLKAEALQHTGSFKFRGAYNALAQIEPGRRGRGVVAYSSGNHAQGVAAAARVLDMPATIVMPSDAPAIKLANTREYGAEIVTYDRYRESREEIAASIAMSRGAEMLPPYDDARVIAGQGTIGLEIAAATVQLGAQLDAVIASCSGGGLISGIALALAAESPKTLVYAAEPEGLDDLRRSLAAGRRLANDKDARSICDALLAPMPGEITFPICRQLLAGSIAVSDDEVRHAMRVAFEDFKLVLEPGGAAALAAVLSGRFDISGKTVAVVGSGGNVDRQAFAAALAAI
jgi:threonine dehydratase